MNELALLAEKLLNYTPANDLAGIVTGGIIGNRADALRGAMSRKLWQSSKQWYQKKIADLDAPVNATLQRAIRRSYLKSLVQTCDQSIAFIQNYEQDEAYLSSQRTKLQALYHKLKRALPSLSSFPLSDAGYQIKLIEIIRIHLLTEIEQVATQENLSDNPADAVFDQLVLWDNMYTLSEGHSMLQHEVHDFVINELKVTRGLDVPEALATLLRLGWTHEGEKHTFFELMCRNFEEEIAQVTGVSEIFNAKMLAMLSEQVGEVLVKVDKAVQVGEFSHAGIRRMEGQVRIISDGVERIENMLSTPNPSSFERHKNMTAQLSELNEEFIEVREDIQWYERNLETVQDEEERERSTKKLQKLNAKHYELGSRRATLQKELVEFEDGVCTLALTLYGKQAVDSPRLQLARTLFEKGDLEGANSVLDPDELERDKTLIEEAESFLNQKRQILVQEYLTKARLVSLDKSNPIWFPEALRYYVIAADLGESYKTCFLAAQFLQKNNHHSIALSHYERALRHAVDASERADIHINIADLYSSMHQFGLAEEELNAALNTYQTLAIKTPQTYLPHVATTLNNLANLYSSTQQPDLAIQKFDEALKIRRTLTDDNSETYLSAVADTLNNLALVHIDEHRFEIAEIELNESLEIRRTLTGGLQEDNLSAVADTLNNLAILHSNFHDDSGKLEKAENEYVESLGIRRILAAINIQAYLPSVADTLNNLAGLHSYMNQIDKTEREFEEALTIRSGLAKSNPSVFQLDFATTLMNISVLYMNFLSDREKSMDFSSRAYRNAYPYTDETYSARKICGIANQIWQYWGEDLQRHLQED